MVILMEEYSSKEDSSRIREEKKKLGEELYKKENEIRILNKVLTFYSNYLEIE